jgi:hypothetical protein
LGLKPYRENYIVIYSKIMGLKYSNGERGRENILECSATEIKTIKGW